MSDTVHRSSTSAQAARIPGFRSEMAAVEGTRLHYRIGGDPGGRPVVLWHGFPGNGYEWHKVGPMLAEAGMSVLIPDMRGYGDSDKPQGVAGYDARALGEECRALVRAIGFGGGTPILLAAHDMGALPALLWAADHPEDLFGLLYIEAPVMLADVLNKIIVYTPEAAKNGSMWWWLLPLAPDVPETLIVGKERAFIEWFYDHYMVRPASMAAEVIDEYLRTFAGREGVLGAMGVYRAAFTTIAQTEPLRQAKLHLPVVAIAGELSLGSEVGTALALVAHHVESIVLPAASHYLPEEQPDEIARQIMAMVDPKASREQRPRVHDHAT